MPVNGLPHTLEMLMSSLCRDNNMKSWQIYQEQSGDITLKVRFECDFGDGHGASQPEHTGNASYKRKSGHRLARDRDRAVAFRERKSENKNKRHSTTQCVNTAPPSRPISHSDISVDMSCPPTENIMTMMTNDAIDDPESDDAHVDNSQNL